MSNCAVHDNWQLEKECTCSPERLWVRQKMLQESLEKLAGKRTPVGNRITNAE